MISRRRIFAKGLVQGLGFRPAIALAARERALSGWVRNTRRGALIEIQGEDDAVSAFLADFTTLLPRGARIDSLEWSKIAVSPGERGFEIAASDAEGSSRFSVPPDLALCPDCEAEFLDPRNRRYLHPFISCGACGPRYTYLREMPYDRSRTSMAAFPPCERCRAEYEDPADRRYHIEGFCCPDCGPRLSGLEEGIAALLAGKVVAVKGIGGYHLACLADEAGAVSSLREGKDRPRKPLAVMYPDLGALRRAAELLDEEAEALASAEAPIVLIPKRRFAILPDSGIAPGNPSIGVFLPYSPLHKLLLMRVARPLALTSANLPGDPLIIDDEAARSALAGKVAAIVAHDRRILKRADDGVALALSAGADAGPGKAVRVIPLRRGRGSAPRPLRLDLPSPIPILALGAELKSTISVVSGEDLATSPHIGDLEGYSAFEHFRRTVLEMLDYYGVTPELVVADLHPDYESTRFGRELAEERGIPFLQVQHHHAHLLSALVDTGALEGPKPALGIVLDGTGYGSDGGIWGGEILLAKGCGFERLGRLEPIPLPGGEAAIREPWRIAAGLGLLARPPEGRAPEELEAVARIAREGDLSPKTSSCGRLFDAAAAILGFDRRIGFEGEAAMWLEALASEALSPAPLPEFPPLDGPALLALLADRARAGGESSRASLALAFHLGLAENVAEAAAAIARPGGFKELALSGGVFQNRIFHEAMVDALERRGILSLVGLRVPVNDGGISVGQAAAGILAAREGGIVPCA